MKIRSNKWYGWRPDLKDSRDLCMAPRRPSGVKLPDYVDLRHKMPPVVNQGALGSCTANAIGAGLHYEMIRQGLTEVFSPSRLFIYWNERAMEGTISEDAGAMIRDGMKTVAKEGVCPESEWEYNVNRFAEKPPAQCYRHALKHQVLKYSRVPQDERSIKTVLAIGLPVVFGFSVYSSFESPVVAKTGMMPMPRRGESLMGGHAVLLVGYIMLAGKLWWIVRNSWGKDWGKAGYFLMPKEYLLDSDLASDFWVSELIETGK
jgi:C1A family cysteine protease